MEGSENTERRALWGPWATAGLGLVVGMVFIVTQMLVVSLFIIMELASDPELNVLQLAESLALDGFVLALSTFATAIICVGLILIIIKLRKGATIAEYLALSPITGKTLLGLMALTAGFVLLSDGLTYFLGRPVIPQVMVEIYKTSVWPPIFWAALILAAPAFEETFFRGFLLEGFRQSRIGNAGALCLTSLAWTSIHLQYGLYELAIIFVGGILLGIVRIKTGSLWSCLFMHAFWNLIATAEMALYVNSLSE